MRKPGRRRASHRRVGHEVSPTLASTDAQSAIGAQQGHARRVRHGAGKKGVRAQGACRRPPPAAQARAGPLSGAPPGAAAGRSGAAPPVAVPSAAAFMAISPAASFAKQRAARRRTAA